MPTLVLSTRYTPDSNRLWQAAIQAQWRVERLQSHRVPDGLSNEAIVLYGEGLFVRVIAEQLGIALFETPYDWLPSLPFAYRQREIRLTTLWEAREISQPTFIKPASDKSFEAQVYEDGAALPPADTFDELTPTLISEPVEWEIEYRCFVAERRLHTCAPYLQGGDLLQDEAGEWLESAPEDEDARAFVNQMLADEQISLPPALVLDVGKIIGRGWAVIEPNPAWASGLYGNDEHEVLSTLRHACAPADTITAALAQWILAL